LRFAGDFDGDGLQVLKIPQEIGDGRESPSFITNGFFGLVGSEAFRSIKFYTESGGERYSVDDFSFAVGPVTAAAPPLVASVLPTSCSAQVGIQVSAFATIINAGANTATGCAISPSTSVAADFLYQTADAHLTIRPAIPTHQ